MSNSSAFDPVAVGRSECAAWAAYYRRDWRRFLMAALGMVREGFRMGRTRSVVGAWYVLRANQAWAPAVDNDPEAARRFMRRFYRLVAASGWPRLDSRVAADLEVRWWAVHRAHQRREQVSHDLLIGSLVDLYAYVYNADIADVSAAAELRVRAMDISDEWVAAGRTLSDPRLAQQRRLLVASYTALREAADRGALAGKSRSGQA